MSKGHVSGVHACVRPLHVCTLLVGLNPSSGKRATFYSLLVLISFLVLYNGQAHTMRRDTEEDTAVTTTIDSSQVYANSGLVALAIIMSCWRRADVLQAMQSISRIDDALASSTRRTISHARTKFYICGYLLFTLAALALLESANCSMLLKAQVPYSAVCWLSCFFALFIPALMEFQFVTWALLLEQRFAIVNQVLIAGGTGIRVMQQCHTALSEIYRHINDIFSLQLLFAIGLLFVKSTVHFLEVFQRFKTDRMDFQMYTSLAWGCYYMGRLFLISRSCESVTNEANSTGYFLHLVNNSAVVMFSKQMIHNKLQFTAFGFFPLEMSLFFSITAAVAMYLLILIQMDTATPGTTDNSTDITLVTSINDTLFA